MFILGFVSSRENSSAKVLIQHLVQQKYRLRNKAQMLEHVKRESDAYA